MWFEATILFFMYILYVYLMMHNEELHQKVLKWMKLKPEQSDSSNEADDSIAITMEDENTPGLTVVNGTSTLETTEDVLKSLNRTEFNRPSKFRAGVLQLMISDKSIIETAGIHAVFGIEGDARETFRKISALHEGDTSTSDTINLAEFKLLLKSLNCLSTQEEMKSTFDHIDSDGDEKINYEDFSKWYLTSEARLIGERKRAFDLIDADSDGTISKDEFSRVLSILEMYVKILIATLYNTYS